MNSPATKVPDLTPPTKVKAEAKPKAEKPPKDPNAPKKERAPRTDYGYSADSKIHIVKDKANKYRGQRKEWFDSLVQYDGGTVGSWLEARKAQKDPPRGWLRFFVQDGTVTLERPPVAVVPATPAA